MTEGDIFGILEIEPTYEEKEIKKAYAKLVKKYHPEEYPEKWKEVYEAYETALRFARAGRERHDGLSMIQPQPSEESDELNALFDNIEALSRQQQNLQKEEQKKAEDSADVSDTLGYDGGKVYSASKTQSRARSFFDGTRTLIKAVSWILVAVISVSGLFLRVARLININGSKRQRQYEQSVESINKMIKMGDTREKMISLYGEPDEWQKDTDNPDYEKAVYHLDGSIDMKVTLSIDEVISVAYETSQDESEGE